MQAIFTNYSICVVCELGFAKSVSAKLDRAKFLSQCNLLMRPAIIERAFVSYVTIGIAENEMTSLCASVESGELILRLPYTTLPPKTGNFLV